MLVKITLVEELPEAPLDHRVLVLLSPFDWQGLGSQPLGRGVHQGGQPGLYSKADHHQRGVVLAFEHPPTAPYGAQPKPNAVSPLEPGNTYWAFLETPLSERERYEPTHDAEGHAHPLKGLSLPVWRSAFLLPYLGPAEFLSAVTSWQEYAPTFLNPEFTQIARSLAHDEEQPTDINRIEFVYRLVGGILGLTLTPGWIQEGERRLTGLKGVSKPTTQEDLHTWLRYIAAAKHDTVEAKHQWQGQPLYTTLTELGSSNEYQVPGALLIVGLISTPYAFVGPASSPGGGGEGNASGRLLPFWIVDLLAAAIHDVQSDDPQRPLSVVYETFRQLEARNAQAFPSAARGSEFDFDVGSYLSPSGSTVFGRPNAAVAIQRRVADLNQQVIGSPMLQPFVEDARYPNPYRALAGWLGVPVGLREIKGAQDHDNLNQWLDQVAANCLHPGQVLLSDSDGYVFVSLKSRVAANQWMAKFLENSLRDPGTDLLSEVDPPLLNEEPGRLKLTPSQAEAFRTVLRWRVMGVTGDPGTGKSFFLHELARIIHEVSDRRQEPHYLLTLAATNRAAMRVAEVLRKDARDVNDIFILGQKGGEWGGEEDEASEIPRLVVGTLDSFLVRINHSPKLAQALLSTPCILAIDEGSMAILDKVAETFAAFGNGDPTGQTWLASSLLKRIVFLGDPYQLPSVEPGDLLRDVMRIIPVITLREQVRAKGSGGLESAFRAIRMGLTDPDRRKAVCQYLLATNREATTYRSRTQDDLKNFLSMVEERPTLFSELGLEPGESSSLRSYVLEDVPEKKPNSAEEHLDFVMRFEDTVRRVVLNELVAWSEDKDPVDPFSDPLPTRKPKQTSVEQQVAHTAFHRFRKAATTPERPFKIVTLLRVPTSDSKQTYYLSSSQRINAWLVDALQGRIPTPPSEERPMTVAPGAPGALISDFQRNWMAVKQQSVDLQRKFLFLEKRPRQISLCPGWPYLVARNSFRSFGVFRGETVYYLGQAERGREMVHRFISETYREIIIPPKLAQSPHLDYGWASNIHQVQGGEYPLVILLWFDGFNFGTLQHTWEQVRRPSTTEDPMHRIQRVCVPLGISRSGVDERMDVRAFYTGLTRTEAASSVPQADLSKPSQFSGMLNTSTAPIQLVPKAGRCVVIAGTSALKRYMALQVVERATPFASSLVNTEATGG